MFQLQLSGRLHNMIHLKILQVDGRLIQKLKVQGKIF